MNIVVADFFSDVQHALAIWSLLLLVAAMCVAFLMPRDKRVRPAAANAPDPAIGPVLKRVRLSSEARELRLHARRLRSIADQAEETARKRREAWLAAMNQAAQTWQAFEEGDALTRRIEATLALPDPETPKTPAEYADRERYLHRAAMRACSHRQLSALDLSDALAHRNGWDPRLHPVKQEVMMQRRIRESLLREHKAAVVKESKAWESAQLAATAVRNLRQEAFFAEQQAREMQKAAGPARAQASKPGLYDTRQLPLARARAY